MNAVASAVQMSIPSPEAGVISVQVPYKSSYQNSRANITQVTPLCVGHEIIGKVIGVGSKVTTCKVEDGVGVGAQVHSCMQCPQCKSDNENYWPNMVDTYNAPYKMDEGHSDKPMKDKNGKQIFSQGGYSSHTRAYEYFVFPIPKNIPSEHA